MMRCPKSCFYLMSGLIFVLTMGFCQPAMADFDITGRYKLLGLSNESGLLDIQVLTDKEFRFELKRSAKNQNTGKSSSCTIVGVGYFYKGWPTKDIYNSNFYVEDSKCALVFTFDLKRRLVKVRVDDAEGCECVFEREFKRIRRKPYDSWRIRRKHCNEEADKIFFARHPEIENRDIEKHIEKYEQEYEQIRENIDECKRSKRRRSCRKKAYEILFDRHPEMSNKKPYQYKRELKREWRRIRREIGGCR